jgi:hypothetical protein
LKVPTAVVEELRSFQQFVRNNLHILLKDPSAFYQLALNQPDASAIYKGARK